MRLLLFLVVLVAVSVLGCGAGGDAAPRADAGALPAECNVEPAPASWTYPLGPYGDGMVGEVFEDFTLQDCEGNDVRFGDLLWSSELVLFNVGAGWCQPCIDETETLERDIHEPFCPRGVKIVQVLFQDEQSRPATKLFCRQWKERFGLRFPVLVDPLFTTSRYFEAAQTPLNLLIDKNGVVRFRAVGTANADLDQRIEELLP